MSGTVCIKLRWCVSVRVQLRLPESVCVCASAKRCARSSSTESCAHLCLPASLCVCLRLSVSV
eukprot:217504-Lingulodinium_polyedra.AAC.1